MRDSSSRITVFFIVFCCIHFLKIIDFPNFYQDEFPTDRFSGVSARARVIMANGELQSANYQKEPVTHNSADMPDIQKIIIYIRQKFRNS